MTSSTSARIVRMTLSAIACAMATAGAAHAQRGTVAGTVTDSASGAPLGGVAVRVAGAQAGTVTRAEGTYRLLLASGSYQLVVSRVGYATARVPVTIAAGETATRDVRLATAATALEGIVAVGTRRPDRVATETPVPVDVVTAADIEATGLTETSQIIQRLAPSVNFPRATIADGTDHIRPATLRGLAPDQALVLVNGKRRHATALVNVNGTVGRGSTSVDLNAIPASVIERIEILREGAAAQYGSDAIAGVINIVLKSGAERELMSSVGRTTEGDGQVVQVGGNAGLEVAGGSLMLGAEFRDRGFTNRSREDLRPQYFAGDPREATVNRLNHRQGDADTRDYGAFLNGVVPIRAGTAELYAFGGVTRREGEAAGFFRRANDVRTVRAIHPDGFLPMITSDILDASAAAGVRGTVAGFRYDLSGVYGSNSFDYGVENSNNVSMGTASPTSFHAGVLNFNQMTANLDLVRSFAAGSFPEPVSVAFGAEYRRDGYGIEAGDTASYVNGGVRVLDGPSAGSIAAVGAQVFPGFRPSDAKDVSRSSVAGYVDVEVTPVQALLVTFAARAENFTDFGSTLDGRVAARVEPVEGFAIRGSVGTGFRAPSLQQQYFSSTATNFIGGVPFDIRTFPVESGEAKVLGAEPLRPEESVNYSLGLAVTPSRDLSVTVDAYQIDIDDRIVFSENFTGARVQQLFRDAGFAGVTGGRFFTNAIDTRTRGIDVVGQYAYRFGRINQLRVVAGANFTETEVLTKVVKTPAALAGFEETLFGRVERGRIEYGQPRNSVNLSLNYTRDRLGVNFNNRRFGEVSVFGAIDPDTATGAAALRTLDQTFDAEWITDLDVSYRFRNGLTLAVGANNLFDVYPEENFQRTDAERATGAQDNSNAGIFPYNGVSPFGFNGAFYYVRFNLRP
ncbi:MAG TPA: TonB-dependent receptor [Longimicrobium sp.]